MKFKELMIALLKVKQDAQKNGLSEKTIQELEIVDTGILGEVNNINLEVGLAQTKGIHCLLIKKKLK